MRPREEALDICINKYATTIGSASTQRYKEQDITNTGMVNGNRQWSDQERRQRRLLGKPSLTFNVIKSRVEYLTSLEVFARHLYLAKSMAPGNEEDALANALSYKIVALHNTLDIALQDSYSSHDMCVSGLGWTNFYTGLNKKNQTRVWKYEHVPSMHMMFDPSDQSQNFSNSSFVIRDRYLPTDYCVKRWPKLRKYFADKRIISPDALDYYNVWDTMTQTMPSIGYGFQGKIVQVSEIQWKEYEKCYSSLDEDGNPFDTFDEDEAISLSYSKNDISTRIASRIYRMLFTKEEVLDYGPLEPSIPDQNNFTYIPCCHRRYDDGTPLAWVTDMIDPQLHMNVCYSDALFAHNNHTIIVSPDAIPRGKTIDDFRIEANRKIGVHQVNDAGRFEIIKNGDMAAGQLEMVHEVERQMSNISNIYAHQYGLPARVESGVALKEQKNQVTQNFSSMFQVIFKAKENLSRAMIDTMIYSGDQNLLSRAGTSMYSPQIILNCVRVINGKQKIVNNIRTFNYSLALEASPEYTSLREEEGEKLRALFSTPNEQTLVFAQCPTILKEVFKIRDPQVGENIAQELMQAQQNIMNMQNQMAMQQQAAAAQSQQQAQQSQGASK